MTTGADQVPVAFAAVVRASVRPVELDAGVAGAVAAVRPKAADAAGAVVEVDAPVADVDVIGLSRRQRRGPGADIPDDGPGVAVADLVGAVGACRVGRAEVAGAPGDGDVPRRRRIPVLGHLRRAGVGIARRRRRRDEAEDQDAVTGEAAVGVGVDRRVVAPGRRQAVDVRVGAAEIGASARDRLPGDVGPDRRHWRRQRCSR